MKPKIKVLLLWLFILGNCFAQNKFKYQTFTDSVVKDGFYQINLLPSIVAKCRPLLDDIRLYNTDKKQIPFFIKDDEITFESNQFIALKKILEKNETNSTKVLIQNTNNRPIDNLVLILKNTTSERSVNISGSNDFYHWYVIKEFINLEMTQEQNADHFYQSISLPIVNYKYFKIIFNGTQYDPMFIEQIGTYKLYQKFKKYFPIPKPAIIQIDSNNKYSYLKLIFQECNKISKLQVFASGTPFYERNIFFEDGLRDADKNPIVAKISSKSNNVFFMNLFMKSDKTDTLKFTIQNDDNPPLKIDSVKAYQNAYALFAYLKAGQKYKLVFGNDSLAAPVYDIAAFSDSIKNAIVLQTGEIITNQITNGKTFVKNKSFNKIWLWTAIISVLLILLYFTSTLLKQIDKKQQTDF